MRVSIGILAAGTFAQTAFAFQPTTLRNTNFYRYQQGTYLKASKEANSDIDSKHGSEQVPVSGSKRKAIQNRVSQLAKRIVTKPIQAVAPQAIASILTDSTREAVDLAIDEVNRLGSIRQSLQYDDLLEKEAAMECDTAIALDTIALAKTTAADAFAQTESAIMETEEALRKSKIALEKCRKDVAKAITIAERSAYQANIASQKATILAASAAISASDKSSSNVDTEEDETVTDDGVNLNGSAQTIEEEVDTESEEESLKPSLGVVDHADISVAELDYDDVDYHLSEMSPPFIGEDQCLVPGEAVVRVEKAKDNSRRIFAGIDILASVDDVWNVLTDYDNLQRVVPNLVVNNVVERYDGEPDPFKINYDINKMNTKLSSEEQCKALSKQMKGSKLQQVGGAKVVGINFSAQVNLEVREWPNGLPDFFHFNDDVYEGISRAERAKMESQRSLQRYHFPRPFAISKLPTKDISMQSVEKDDGEFRLYQGVWRMQPLPGCAPQNGSAMRLTYAVEISPRPYLPVALVEGRISKDLCNNLLAIRDFVTK